MKVKDLIKLLQSCDQEAEINFQLGHNDAYRKACAKIALEDDGTANNDGLTCLKCMCIDQMIQTQMVYAEESELLVILEQDYYAYSFFEDYVITGIVNNELKGYAKKV